MNPKNNSTRFTKLQITNLVLIIACACLSIKTFGIAPTFIITIVVPFDIWGVAFFISGIVAAFQPSRSYKDHLVRTGNTMLMFVLSAILIVGPLISFGLVSAANIPVILVYVILFSYAFGLIASITRWIFT